MNNLFQPRGVPNQIAAMRRRKKPAHLPPDAAYVRHMQRWTFATTDELRIQWGDLPPGGRDQASQIERNPAFRALLAEDTEIGEDLRAWHKQNLGWVYFLDVTQRAEWWENRSMTAIQSGMKMRDVANLCAYFLSLPYLALSEGDKA
ncbi:hypothetical protein [Pantoea sp. ME81]|uniref:hypothetical protein n=1 Tax=Pantoea sp. ME81 TaxID=2743935 RepID=UPI0015F76CB6|nr:hypothetical protein [Pantoea sp. ME81]